MFGKNSAKAAQTAATASTALTNQRLDTAGKSTPLQDVWEKGNLDFLNWENSAGKDVMNAPTMQPYLGLYNNAIASKNDDVQGQGLLSMGDANMSSGLLSMIKQNRADRRQERAAGALENAFAGRHAEATGAVMPLATLNANRALQVANQSGQLSTEAQRRADMLKQQSGFLNSNLYKMLQQGASTAASVYTGGLSGAAQRASSSGAPPMFARGGNWTPHLGRPVRVNEEGEESVLLGDGSVRRFGGGRNKLVVPTEPGVVLNAEQTRGLASMANTPRLTLDHVPKSPADLLNLVGEFNAARAPQLTTPASVDGSPRTADVLPPPQMMTRPRLSMPVSPAMDADGVRPQLNLPPLYPDAPAQTDAMLTGGDIKPRLLNPNITLDPARGATRDRVADPTSFALDRVKGAMLEAPREDRNGGLKSVLKTAGLRALSGLAHGGVGGALAGAVGGAVEGGFNHAADERIGQAQDLNRDRQLAGELFDVDRTKAALDLAKQKPALELSKVENKRRYDAWRMASGNRKADSAESYLAWRMADGDVRTKTAQGRLELQREWQTVIQPQQFAQTFDQRDRFEAGRNEDRDLSREATNARFERTFGLASERFGSAEAKRVFETETKGNFEKLRGLQKRIESYHTASAKEEMRPETARARIVELETEAARVQDEIEGARDKALGGGASSPAPRLSSPAPRLAPPVRRGGVGSVRPAANRAPAPSEDSVRAAARAAGLDPDEAVRRLRARSANR